MKINLKSLKAGLSVGGRRVAIGEIFAVRGESEARVLIAIGAAARVEDAPPAPTYQTRVLTAKPRQMLPALPESAYAPAAAPIPVQPASDLDDMDRDALYDLTVSLGLKPHHLTGAAKLRAAIAEHRAAQ